MNNREMPKGAMPTPEQGAAESMLGQDKVKYKVQIFLTLIPFLRKHSEIRVSFADAMLNKNLLTSQQRMQAMLEWNETYGARLSNYAKFHKSEVIDMQDPAAIEALFAKVENYFKEEYTNPMNMESRGPSPLETDQEVVLLLRDKVREAATSAAKDTHITEADIASITAYLVRSAEKAGTPYTADDIKRFDKKTQTEILDGILARIHARPDVAPILHDSHGNVIGPVPNVQAAEKIAEQERTTGK